MAHRKKWRLVYGAIYVGAAAALIVALATHASAIAMRKEVASFAAALTLPFREWWKMFRRARNRKPVSV